MREKINFDKSWKFHRGEIEIPLPINKAAVYEGAKTERMLRGPASRSYNTGAFATETWTWVNLPHDYIIEGVPDRRYNEGLGFFPYDNAWYVKKFRLEECDRGRRITLLFDGVATHATVYVNGCCMKRNFCGYTSFEVDITDVVEYGEKENTLSVYVNTQNHEGWWYEGAVFTATSG